ncbi:hypothetical protein [Sphingomonas sp.]|uniref:hypothetical protein n=1 Tax=Sphingomonas sp. TaxID=28214 RepID=UPI0035BC22DB
MPQFETITLPFGKVKRRHAPIKSPTLLALPESERPKPVLGCMTCPAGGWYLDEDALACHCAIRRYVSWLPGQKAIILCDDREQALDDEEKQEPEG